MGETRVDLWHLLEDLRDAYPNSLDETILTEIIANSLDSGATEIDLQTDSSKATFVVIDNGSGMQRRSLTRYHDIAASSKTRGQGIGFAGVGIKLGLLVCQEVVTETRRGKTHVATVWHLASRYRAPWKWIPPPGMVRERGTAVRLTMQNGLSPLLDPSFLGKMLRRHFQPLMDSRFDQFLSSCYPKGILFRVNGRVLPRTSWTVPTWAPLEVRLLRKRKPSAFGYLIRHDASLPDESRGLAISTYGKVIKRGWDWLGVSPSSPERVDGLIEVPALASSLTLNKGDFIRVGSRGAAYLGYRKAIQEAVSRQLAAWGDTHDRKEEERPKLIRPLKRDLERILEDLSDSFPLLDSLVEHRAGGQKRLPLGKPGSLTDMRAVAVTIGSLVSDDQPESDGFRSEGSGGGDGEPNGSEAQNEPPGSSPPVRQIPHSEEGASLLPERGGPRRPARYGLDIQFEERPGMVELGRLVQSTIYVNQSHPAYQRAVVSHALGYHIALTVALALASLAVEPKNEHAFLTTFLGRWGDISVPPQRTWRRKK